MQPAETPRPGSSTNAGSGFLGPTSHIFVSQRLRLHYVDWGNPDAPLLILLHGGRDHARSWDWVAQSLRDEWHVIAPDLRGHGDSAWSPDGAYLTPYFVYDLAQLIHQQGAETVRIVAHSMGGAIALCYAGLFPAKLCKLVAIEGLGLSPRGAKGIRNTPLVTQWSGWIDECRAASGRLPRRYDTIEDALARMQAENRHLSADQARHLTVHGVTRNEDGTYTWKFDNYVRLSAPVDIADDELKRLWGRIACPTLLCYGLDSWASNPAVDGRAGYFSNSEVVTFPGAGHWLHHDQFDAFMRELRRFL